MICFQRSDHPKIQQIMKKKKSGHYRNISPISSRLRHSLLESPVCMSSVYKNASTRPRYASNSTVNSKSLPSSSKARSPRPIKNPTYGHHEASSHSSDLLSLSARRQQPPMPNPMPNLMPNPIQRN